MSALKDALKCEMEIRAGDMAFEVEADLVFEAARRVAEADEVWWCEVHRSPTGDRLIDGASKCFLAVDEGLWAYACRFKGRLLLPAEEEK